MHKHSFLRPALALTFTLFSVTVALPTPGYCQKATSRSQKSEKKAIARVLNRELGRATRDHIKVTPFALTGVDVRGSWALADIKPLGPDAIDPVSVVLQKKQGQWKVVTLGSNLLGAGKQYNIPRSLWKRWHVGL